MLSAISTRHLQPCGLCMNFPDQIFDTLSANRCSGYVISQIPSQLVCTRGRLKCVSLDQQPLMFTSSETLYLVSVLGAPLGSRNVCFFFCENSPPVIRVSFFCKYDLLTLPFELFLISPQVGLAEGTFYPAVHTVLGGWYNKRGTLTLHRQSICYNC